MDKNNPFNTFNAPFASTLSPLKALSATPNVSPQELAKRQEQSGKMPTSVSFPPHLFIPEGAQSVDIRRVANVPAGSQTDLIIFTGPPGKKIKFISYAVFSNALIATTVKFVPTVNGARVFPFHGDPQLNFTIDLGLGPDLTNNSLIDGQLDIQPGQVLKWTFFNNALVDIAAGIRMKGYVDTSTTRSNGRVGG